MTILDELKEMFALVFADQYNHEALTEDSHLINDIGMNSISLLYMAMVIEEKYGIQFNNDDFKMLNTVADVITLIERKISK